MGKYNIFYLFENPRRGMQARNFTTNVPKILDLKSSSEQIFPRKLSLGTLEVRPEPLQTFQPSYASSKVKNDAIRNRISDFDKRRISQPKTQKQTSHK